MKKILFINVIKTMAIVFGFVISIILNKNTDCNKIKCLVIGYCGVNSTGAESRTYEAIKQIRECVGENIIFTVYTSSKKITSRYIKENEFINICEMHPLDIINSSILIARNDVLILSEGSAFKDNFSSLLLWCYLYSFMLAERLSKITVTFAVDVGEMNSDNKKFTMEIANKIDLLMVRTEHSKKLLENIGVTNNIEITADTAFEVKNESNEWFESFCIKNNISTNSKLVGISVREFFCWPVEINLLKALKGEKEDKYDKIFYHSWTEESKSKSIKLKQILAEYADWCSEKYDATIILIAMEHMDKNYCDDIEKLMHCKPIIVDSDTYNAFEISSILSNLRFLISTRYHAIILSMKNNIPFIGISHDERIKNLMKELDLFDNLHIDYLDNNFEQKLKHITNCLNDYYEEYSKKIELAYPEYIVRMKKNSVLFKELLIKKELL